MTTNYNHTDLSIFTNKNENGIKLSDRLNTVLTNSKYFDALVGYFRITGFYLLQEKLESVEEIRILIGLDTDETVIKTMDIFEMSSANATYKIKEVIRDEFSKSEDDNLVMENGIMKFIEWIDSGKLKIRMCYEKNVHAKLYIVRKDPEIVPDQFGNIITGSSNFTYNGLEKNVEFNVELKDSVNVKYALEFFEDLWKESKEITEDVKTTIEQETWLNANITPYELFLKMLFVFFEEEITTRKHDYEWPEGYMNLQYQEDAVTQARKVLAKHGGVIIADVVGLGKTYISAMLGKLLDGRKLFIVPPVVKDNWEKVLAEFGYKMSDKVVSLGIIDQVAEWYDLDSYKYVFVDEAHRFRNSSSTEYEHLKKICYNKGVILITATPQNNNIYDIASLIMLFQDSKRSSIIPTSKDLDKYFSDLNKKLKQASGTDEYETVTSQVTASLRDNVLRHILIRRTRSEIIKYYEDDLKAQGLKFPKVDDPIRLDYMYNDAMEESFNETIQLLKQFTYARYTPLLYLKDKKRIGSNKARQENMKGFVKTMLVKRLESSIYAFTKTIDRLLYSSTGFIKLYESGKILVGNGTRAKQYDFFDLEQMEEELFRETIENNDIDCFKPADFQEDFIEKVRQDDRILKRIKELWYKNDLKENDSKYDELLKTIKKIKDEKIVIFSEAKDTVDYLTERLSEDFGDGVISYDGSDSSSKKQYIQYNFDPYFSKREINDKKILIATDALSEGINLHIASNLINYDLPWNPTRVMQRMGRINRVGSINSVLHTFNFFPRANVKEHLSLEDSIKHKVQMFHELLGEDSKIITEDEKPEAYELYDFLMMANKLPDEIEMGTNALQMSFIQKLDDIMKNNKDLFERITNLPDKIRVARLSEDRSMVTFIKQGLIKKFIINDGEAASEIEFEEAVKLLESDESDRAIQLPEDYYDLLDTNKKAFSEIILASMVDSVISVDSPNEKKAKKFLRAMINSPSTTNNEKEYLMKIDKAAKRGSLNKRMYKNIMDDINKDPSSAENIINAFKKNIDESYLTTRTNYKMVDSLTEKETIVLSEYFVKKG